MTLYFITYWVKSPMESRCQRTFRSKGPPGRIVRVPGLSEWGPFNMTFDESSIQRISYSMIEAYPYSYCEDEYQSNGLDQW